MDGFQLRTNRARNFAVIAWICIIILLYFFFTVRYLLEYLGVGLQ